jgi:hypothetical protein
MTRKNKTVWLAVGAFVASVWIASAVQLAQSYRLAVETAFVRSDLPGHLVSEWIVESFHTVELVLRESLADFDSSSLPSAPRTDDEDQSINAALSQRAAMHGHMVFLGIFDPDCVIRFGSIDSIIGDSSADLKRDYCEEVHNPPVGRLKLSEFFVSSTGDMNVSATYPMVSRDGEVTVV